MPRPLVLTFPIFRVARVDTEAGAPHLIGSLTATNFGRETWVDDEYIGYLRRGATCIRGRWRKLTDLWEFTLADPHTIPPFHAEEEVEVFDGYWGERAQLVLSESTSWSPATWRQSEDHDHCAICWATISAHENRSHVESSDGVRVCPACYRNYVQVRSLAFITAA